MSLPSLQFISWTQMHLMGFKLAQELNPLRPDLNTIVSISRGGHVLARILSDFMDLPIFSVSIQSYTALKQHELKITQELGIDLSDQHVLLVDEIVDTGRTLERAIPYLQGLGAKQVTSVAMHIKPKATMKADYFIESTDKWVVYPYEVRETIQALKSLWQDAGWNQDQMLQALVDGGMEKEFVDKYLGQ